MPRLFLKYFLIISTKNWASQKRCFAAAKKTMQKLDGSYSVIAVIRDVGFLLFVILMPFVPLFMVKKQKKARLLLMLFHQNQLP
jgi:hypothetical protein